MEKVNFGRDIPIRYLYWYATTGTMKPIYNTANSMFYTGHKDMKKYFGIFYPFYEALRTNYDEFMKNQIASK